MELRSWVLRLLMPAVPNTIVGFEGPILPVLSNTLFGLVLLINERYMAQFFKIRGILEPAPDSDDSS